VTCAVRASVAPMISRIRDNAALADREKLSLEERRDDHSLLTIRDFCRSEQISAGTFYNLERIGRAPRILHIGRAVRITPEARDAWRLEMMEHPLPIGLKTIARPENK
jgi:predicted DNA-binding transcriptional regulator AlpA